MPSLKVVTWNINFRTVAALEPLLDLSPRPDVITLQEVTRELADSFASTLKDAGYESICSGDPESPDKRYGNIIAAREVVAVKLPAKPRLPWRQLVSHATVATEVGLIHVVTVHAPNGCGNGWKKIDTLDALKQLVIELKGELLVLTGDFNEPRYAMQDGQVVTWGQEKIGDRWQVADGEWEDKDGDTHEWRRWDNTVRWFFGSPVESGLRNAYWDAAGDGMMEASHISRGNPRWFDHAFVSDRFRVDECRYLHAFREGGFSDHSALEATLGWALG